MYVRSSGTSLGQNNKSAWLKKDQKKASTRLAKIILEAM
ncbi:hypothetical protein AZ012_002230 [Citrobacter amalonaticus]|nr:hypothetical protein AZ012_002230 [Citrobacter amalonaticus]